MTTDYHPPTRIEGPRRMLELDGHRITLLGTAHVSKASAEEVANAIDSGEFTAVAIELDPARHAALSDQNSFARLDLWQAWKGKKLGMVTISLALGAFQQRLADQLGIEPGAEMRTAIERAREHRLPLWLIDRDIGLTLRRVIANVPWWQRATLLVGVLGSVVSRQPVQEADIERLKEGDVLAATFAEFAEDEARIYAPLITERDRFMAGRLRQELRRLSRLDSGPHSVLAVVGAGHLAGIASALEAPDPGEVATAEELLSLQRTPVASRLSKALPWLMVGLVFVGFAIGFSREQELGWRLLFEWTIINGGLAGLGAAIALAHPITVLATAVAAPFTSLNPMVGAGFVAAGVELAIRRPRVGDVANLRRDVTEWRGWWKNRAARALLVFLFATIGSAAGTYIAGFRIIDRLIG